MFGGAGNDTYNVDDAGDVVREDTIAGVDDGGIDTGQASVSYTLGSLHREADPDRQCGDRRHRQRAGQHDHRQRRRQPPLGLGGNDILTGGNGADIMDGGEGSDSYNVDDSDIVHDTGRGGNDTVIAAGGYTLAAGSGIENLAIKAGTTATST